MAALLFRLENKKVRDSGFPHCVPESVIMLIINPDHVSFARLQFARQNKCPVIIQVFAASTGG
jgi:hypothetical protein